MILSNSSPPVTLIHEQQKQDELQFHDEVKLLGRVENLFQANNVGVIDLSQDIDFCLQALLVILSDAFLVDNLHSKGLPSLLVDRFADNREAATEDVSAHAISN
jgi:hypothetical protein